LTMKSLSIPEPWIQLEEENGLTHPLTKQAASSKRQIKS